jgi:hypothetical protein
MPLEKIPRSLALESLELPCLRERIRKSITSDTERTGAIGIFQHLNGRTAESRIGERVVILRPARQVTKGNSSEGR